MPLGLHERLPAPIRRCVRHRLGYFYPWEPGYDHRAAPRPQQGEETGPPGFVGIGVEKGGTSWWHRLILSHPDAVAPHSGYKEHHYFNRFGIEPFGPEDVATYWTWFPRPPGMLTGEWTPTYFDAGWAPALLAKAAPDAKILLILRDPIERFRSGLAHHGRGEGYSGREQIRAFERSLYAEGVRRWQAQVPSDRLLILQYERCRDDPAGQLRRTYAFLGLDPSFEPSTLNEVFHKTTWAKPQLAPDEVERLRIAFSPDVQALVDLVPDLELDLWPRFARGA